ncbi:MAG: phosphoenolpyruvate--protein phosphotransferase [bacterium]
MVGGRSYHSKSLVMKGEKIVAGIGVGRNYFIDKNFSDIPHNYIENRPEKHEEQKKRFVDAVKKAKTEIMDTIKEEHLPKEAVSILKTHKAMLTDKVMHEKIFGEIEKNNINVEWAVLNVFKQLEDMLLGSGGNYYSLAKTADMKTIQDKILSYLINHKNKDVKKLPIPDDDFIICSQNLSITEINPFVKSGNLKGVALEASGGVSHLTVVLRAYGIPAVLGIKNLISELDYNDCLIVDGVSGNVILRPGKKERTKYIKRKKRYDSYYSKFLENVEEPAVSRDGSSIDVEGNIEMLDETNFILKYGADAVGLFRTEFMFLDSQKPPSEEEHYKLYYEILHRLEPKKVTVRIFDFGGDKEGNIINTKGSMGRRGIRLFRTAPHIFRPQIRGMLKASELGNLNILLPFVSSTEEVLYFKKILHEEAENLNCTKNLKKIELGAMIELPAAFFIAEELAETVDFFSVGTNDLIQYLMAVERNDKSLSRYFSHFHPAVIRILYKLSRIASRSDTKISICGEIGGDPYFSLLFLGMGIDSLSMSPVSIPVVKKIIKSGYYQEGRDLLDKVLKSGTEHKLKKTLKNDMKEKYPNIFKSIWTE